MTTMNTTPGALHVTLTPTADLHPFPGNARQGDIGAIVESLRHHGQYRPLVVQAGTMHVIAGNHTLQAAQQLGWTEIAATILDVTDDQAQRLNIVDNRTQDLATNNEYALAALLRDLTATQDGLAGTGYTLDDLDDLLTELAAPPATSGDTDPGAPPDTPRTQPGDVWTLGNHRLTCGDSTDPTTVEKVLAGNRPDLIVTDPPYGVSYASIGRINNTPDKQHAPISNDSLTPEQTGDLFAEALSIAGLRAGGGIYATVPSGPLLGTFIAAFDRGLGDGALRQILVWVKDSLGHGTR